MQISCHRHNIHKARGEIRKTLTVDKRSGISFITLPKALKQIYTVIKYYFRVFCQWMSSQGQSTILTQIQSMNLISQVNIEIHRIPAQSLNSERRKGRDNSQVNLNFQLLLSEVTVFQGYIYSNSNNPHMTVCFKFLVLTHSCH